MKTRLVMSHTNQTFLKPWKSRCGSTVSHSLTSVLYDSITTL